jgi:hypothetical protein
MFYLRTPDSGQKFYFDDPAVQKVLFFENVLKSISNKRLTKPEFSGII